MVSFLSLKPDTKEDGARKAKNLVFPLQVYAVRKEREICHSVQGRYRIPLRLNKNGKDVAKNEKLRIIPGGVVIDVRPWDSRGSHGSC